VNDVSTPPQRLGWLKLSGRPVGFLVPCALVGVAVALVPWTGLRALGAPVWLALVAAAAVFPLLPLFWHILAERRYGGTDVTPASAFVRLALRALAVALVVLGTSLSTLGPRQVRAHLAGLVPSLGRAPLPAAPPPAPEAVREGLEPFIPADATLVVSLAGSQAMEQLLAAHGVDTREKLAALAKCKIEVERARVLIAARGDGQRQVVVRARGLTDERNLYCLMGVLGNDRVQIHFVGKDAPGAFEVRGLIAKPLTFHPVDDETIATDEAWRQGAKKMFANGPTGKADGRLTTVLSRVDRAAAVWSASVTETTTGAWDLALDARVDGPDFKLRGTSLSPTGEAAEVSLRVPLAFASALPEGALAHGVRGVVAAVAATGATLPVVGPTKP
jgi:hypothetical protein